MSALDKAKGLWGSAAAVQGNGESDRPKHDPNMFAKANAMYADALTWGKPEGQDLGDMVAEPVVSVPFPDPPEESA